LSASCTRRRTLAAVLALDKSRRMDTTEPAGGMFVRAMLGVSRLIRLFLDSGATCHVVSDGREHDRQGKNITREDSSWKWRERESTRTRGSLLHDTSVEHQSKGVHHAPSFVGAFMSLTLFLRGCEIVKGTRIVSLARSRQAAQ
jgi:hypothetical protein